MLDYGCGKGRTLFRLASKGFRCHGFDVALPLMRSAAAREKVSFFTDVRDLDSQYRDVRLGFDKNNLVMMILHDNLGQITRIDFLNPERNKRFGGPLFTFTPPEGVDVIDERQTN